MKKITVLGTGMVGSAVVKDLCNDFKVYAADMNEKSLNKIKSSHPVETIQADLSDKKRIIELIKNSDLIIDALPGFMGFETLKTVIENKKNIVDIAFFNEDPFKLDDLAKKNQVIAVMDCGVAPGMSNIILGHHNQTMDIESFECFVGGLPLKRTRPYEYKAPFSPIDVLEEYIRVSRIVENGKIVEKPALSEPELIEFDQVGTLESFNTDGLRTLIKTMNIPQMKEKTLRYPGHIKLMRILRESGFFSKNPIEINNTEIRPLDFTSKLLFPLWKLKENEKEFTLMEIRIHGHENNREKEYLYTLYDQFDEKSGISSMARTTGYPCCAAARLILNGNYNKTGISPPEFIGADQNCFNDIIEYLKQRGIEFIQKEKNI